MLSYICLVKIEEAIQQRTFKSPQQKAILNLMYTASWFTGVSEQLFKGFDITPQQFNVLRILRGRHPQPLCAGEIKAVMIDKNPDLTRLCDRLLAKQLIERQLNAANRRQILIGIAPAGLALLERIEPTLEGRASQFHHLSDADAAALSDLLDGLRG